MNNSFHSWSSNSPSCSIFKTSDWPTAFIAKTVLWLIILILNSLKILLNIYLKQNTRLLRDLPTTPSSQLLTAVLSNMVNLTVYSHILKGHHDVRITECGPASMHWLSSLSMIICLVAYLAGYAMCPSWPEEQTKVPVAECSPVSPAVQMLTIHTHSNEPGQPVQICITTYTHTDTLTFTLQFSCQDKEKWRDFFSQNPPHYHPSWPPQSKSRSWNCTRSHSQYNSCLTL